MDQTETHEVVIDEGIEIRFRVEPDAWLPIAQLQQMAHLYNSQVRTTEDEHAIWASILERGYIGEPILVNPWNQKLIAGHGRVKVLAERGYRGTLPVVFEKYQTEAEHRMAMLRANMARGHQDAQRLEAELAFMRQAYSDEQIEQNLGLQPDSLQSLDTDEDAKQEDTDAMMAEAAEDEATAAAKAAEKTLDEEGICGVHLLGWNEIHEFSVPSIRRWVRDRKDVEMAWFRKRRAAFDTDLAREVAAEMGDRLLPLFGSSTLPMWVTTPPRATVHDLHFATQAALFLAEELGIAYVQVFSDWPTEGDRQRTREQGNAILRGDLPEGLCILVDDYAVTGKTLAAAGGALRRKQAAVLPIVWIYGEAAYGRAIR
jgi:hypothetical protein